MKFRHSAFAILFACTVVSFAQPSDALAAELADDGDKEITVVDLILFAPDKKVEGLIRSLKRFASRYDRNRDGLTLAELEKNRKKRSGRKSGFGGLDSSDVHSRRIFEFLMSKMVILRPSEAAYVAGLLELDPEKDGKLTQENIDELIAAGVRRWDRNGDGTLDQTEKESLRAAVKLVIEEANGSILAAMDKKTQRCRLPEPAPEDMIVVFGARGGGRISTAWLGDPENLTTIRDIEVDAGERPIFLILSSMNSVIWRLSGATERISRVIVLSQSVPRKQYSGIVGLEKQRVEIVDPGHCPTYAPHDDEDYRSRVFAVQNRKAIELALGKDVDVFARSKLPEIIALPSKRARDLPKRDEPFLRKIDPELSVHYDRLFPGGIENIDPSVVEAAVPVMPYSVLPSYVGLIQLLKDGAIERIGRREYRIVKRVKQLPADLPSGLRLTYMLGKGIPMPGEPLGDACILSDETGQQLNPSARCRKR